jgi:ferritin-like metal-binding protein YciE
VQHIRGTQGQIARLEEILNGLGEDSSAPNDIALTVAGAVSAMDHSMAGDEILNNSFANYAFEDFEITAGLITLAELGGYPSKA